MIFDYVSSVEIALMYLEMIQFVVSQTKETGTIMAGYLELKVEEILFRMLKSC